MMMLSYCLPQTRNQVLALWIALLVIGLAIRAILEELGELILATLLVACTAIRFSCGCKSRETNSNLLSEGDVRPTVATTTGSSGGGEFHYLEQQKGSVSQNGDAEAGSGHTESLESGGDMPTASDDSRNDPRAALLVETTTMSGPPIQQEESRTTDGGRLLFLDNVKTFLTAIVVTFHVSCAFGSCGQGWFLVVGYESPDLFQKLSGAFVLFNQAYFMSLFFFISAYFVPQSYAKRGLQQFVEGKKRRILIPALVTCFAITPACIAIGAFVSQSPRISYIPDPGHGWFLFWLLLLNWVYMSVAEVTKAQEEENRAPATSEVALLLYTSPTSTGDETNVIPSMAATESASSPSSSVSPPTVPFPRSTTRILYGIGVCGILMLGVNILSPGTFASMPVSVGSLTCDLLMFYAGTLARTHGWLEQDLKNQMDISSFVLVCMVLAEVVGMAFLTPRTVDGEIIFVVVFFVLGGMFCLDMSLLILLVFQRFANAETALSRRLARAAYGVYILHPVVICGVTALYIALYNRKHDDIDAIEFPAEPDQPFGTGGGDSYPLGWVGVTVASHLIVWPLSYGLTQLPGVRNIL